MSKLNVIGWDIGGANLKAVLLDVEGSVLNRLQTPCPLWHGLDTLASAIKVVLKTFNLNPHDTQHAITMTGELVDLFPNRHTGVVEIAQLAISLLGNNCQFYAASKGFLVIEQVSTNSSFIASTNWHASASLLAQHLQDALLIDIGSTTSDIIAIESGKVLSSALCDARRLQQDTLVYTGVIRTPVMVLAQKIALSNIETNVMAEYFATMADVYRLTGELESAVDMAETADGKGKTQHESARRLARMVGYDVEEKPMNVWIELAFSCRAIQLKQLKTAVLKHLKPNTPIIGAGAGSFLAKVLATELNCAYLSINELPLSKITLPTCSPNSNNQQALNVCFPAYAVARLSLQNHLSANLLKAESV